MNKLLRQTMIATIYVVIVYLFSFLSFQEIQFRIAEALLILIFFDYKNIYGLTLGTFVSNWLLSPFGLIDALFGSIATILSLIFMLLLKKHKIIALLMPAIFNGLVIGYLIYYIEQIPFIYSASLVFVGEVIVMAFLGYPLYKILEKHPYFLEIFK